VLHTRRAQRSLIAEAALLVPAVLLATVPGLALHAWALTLWRGGPLPSDSFLLLLPFLGRWFEYTVLGMILALVAIMHERTVTAEQDLHVGRLQRMRLEGQVAEARLQRLQSQIEPHFLFNTLANVRRLMQSDAAAARAMLRQLQRYLQVSLPRMREPEVSLGDELALIEAYLQIQSIRMGTRLRWKLDVPSALTAAALPPMILGTLVENAIKHGLGPLPEGGVLQIRAWLEGTVLRLQVADDGRGFEGSSGSGVGLANIRTRLRLLYGGAARLCLTSNAPRGVVAVLELPWHTAEPT
jgi:LytS/YehU family sensor histidine kinase